MHADNYRFNVVFKAFIPSSSLFHFSLDIDESISFVQERITINFKKQKNNYRSGSIFLTEYNPIIRL